jgi:hypothetical protein
MRFAEPENVSSDAFVSIGQAIRRDHFISVHQQCGEQEAQLRAPQRRGRAIQKQLEWPKSPESHAASAAHHHLILPPSAPDRCASHRSTERADRTRAESPRSGAQSGTSACTGWPVPRHLLGCSHDLDNGADRPHCTPVAVREV